ncbi:hypothetical protein [Actinocrispum sp. NPDC049592]|uniref:hypothetical protein n=1 Tax=Actinocrispum sp. NPDC049592 TaxID=3154835 RepID=UPI0034344F40
MGVVIIIVASRGSSALPAQRTATGNTPSFSEELSSHVAEKRTSGLSRVQSTTMPSVALRSSPSQPPFGTSTAVCSPLTTLPNGTQVQMRCWEEGNAPVEADDPSKPGPISRKWFYVTIATGEHTGWSGYVHADLVKEQIDETPRCTKAIMDAYPMGDSHPAPPIRLVFKIVGTCTTTGGTLTAQSSGFAPGGEYAIGAAYPDGSTYPLPQRFYTVNSDGSVNWHCPTQMREDGHKAYLSTVPENMCRTRGCALSGTEMGTGDQVTVDCVTNGARTTNGQDNSPVDDGNPSLASSTRWYRGHRNGQTGFISEVWIAAQHRGLGLPLC